MNKNTLYITYDGLSDPLGKAQIIPYIISIAKHPRKLIVLSFEKKNKISEINDIKNLLRNNNIIWINLRFSNKLKVVSKFLDIIKIFFYSIYLTKKYKIKIIHGRGTLPSLFGYIVKKIFNIKLLFDCRGMWADERKDNNQWNSDNVFFILIYKIFKKIEDLLFLHSNQVVVLSNKIIPYLDSKYKIKKKISVIPCSVDYDFFKANQNIDKSLILESEFKIYNYQFVFCYSGSLGGIYQLEEMLNFFLNVNKIYKNTFFIFFTQNIEILKKELTKKKYLNIKNNIKYKALERNDLPRYISVCDAMIYFIKPTFSKKASCPTKLGESLSLGIPVITNNGIGDIEDLFTKIKPGLLLNEISSNSFKHFIENIEFLRTIKGVELREKSKIFFDLKKANDLYESVYLQLDQ